MHPSNGRKRYRMDEEEELAVTRIDQHRENYTSHSRHDSHNTRSNSYRGGNSSRRVSYPDTSSRSHRDSDDWRGEASHSSGHERFPTESYHHNRRDDYLERPERSTSDHWQTRSSNRYSNSKRESRRTEITQSYAEERTWVVSARYEEIKTESRRGDSPRHDHEKARYEPDDPHFERDRYNSHRNEHRVEQSPERASSKYEHGEKSQPAEDRTWVPSASWKPGSKQRPSQRAEFQSSRNNDKRSGRSNPSRKGHQVALKRNWRLDDSKTNNWQKREATPKNSTNASYNRDQFPSRSPSPSPSISRQSSIRSRSPSLSSPRRPPRQSWKGKERKLSNNIYPENKRKNQKQRRPSVSPSTARKNGDGWGRSRKSSISASSRSRSHSRSPSESADEKPKAKHRLPTATSIHDIKKSKKDWRPPVELPHYSGELLVSNGRDWKPDPPTQNEPPEVLVETSQPPQIKRPISPAVVQESAAHLAPVLPFTRAEVTYNKSTVVAIKKPGFKPINQSSASMKKFFPGDDDESDRTSTRDEIPPTRSPAHTPTRSPREDRNGYSSLRRRSSNEWPPRDRSPYDRSPRRSYRKSSPMERMGPRGREEYASHHREDSEAYDNSYQHSPIADEQGLPKEVEPQQELYAIVNQVGEGTFGKVYKARNTVTGVNVALKRIRMEAEKDGFPVTAMREIKLLQSLRHQNIVQLYEMMVSSGAVYMVFEYMDHDLTGVLSQTQFSFTDAHLKSLCQQMLAGLAYLHHKGVIHRDIKGSNILINNRGQLKLADFGLARFYQKRRRSDYTNRVITLWYRPPELLLGTTVYGPEVDMWSAGCIMLELYCKKPVFQGEDEIHQLEVIYKILGTPTPADWPGLTDMPWFELVKVKENIRNRFKEFFNRWMSPAALDLAERLLTFDPERRVTAAQALATPYFSDEQPPPSLPVGLATLEGEWHEFESKRERAKKRRKIEEQQSSA